MIAKIIEASIRQRFFVIIATLLVIGIGIYSVWNTKIDAIPDLSDVQVIVYTEYKGQSPRIIEDQVTYPLTTTLVSVPGAKTVRGYSFFGYSLVYVIFEDGTDLYWARSRVLETMNTAQKRLPQGIIPTLGPDATGVGWIYEYALVSEKHSLQELRSLQDWFLKYELSSVPGVSEVASIGGFVKQYQVSVDPRRLQNYGIRLSEVEMAIANANGDEGGETIEMGEAEFMIRGVGYLKSIADLEGIPIRKGGVAAAASDMGAGMPGSGVTTSTKNEKTGEPMSPAIYLRDIATVTIGPEMRRGVAELNGEGEAAGGIVVMRSGENAVQVIKSVQKKLKELQQGLPAGMKMVPTYDRSSLIERSVNTLKNKLLEEILVVALVCLIFLLHARSALVAVFVLPTAILMGFIVMRIQGLNANIMSLGGIAIAIGAMVDAAIIMIENAHKHLEEESKKPPEAQKPHWTLIAESAKEVGPSLFFSLVVITLSFIPIFTLDNQEGRMFRPLAFTKTYSMAAASILAITIVPVLMGYFVRGKIIPENRNPINRFLEKCYHPLMHATLRHPLRVMAVCIAILAATLIPLRTLGSEFMPPLQEGDILYMPTTLPGISIGKSRELLQQTDKLIKTVPEVKSVFGKAGRAETATDPAGLDMFETIIQLKPESEWRKGFTLNSIIADLDRRVQVPGLTNSWTMPIKTRIDMLSTGIKTPVGIKISGPNLDTLQQIGLQLEALMREVPGTASAFAERTVGGNYLEIRVKRDEAGRYGISVENVRSAIRIALGGMPVTTTVEGLERYSVNVRYPREMRDSPEKIGKVLIDLPGGGQIPLSFVADIVTTKGPMVIRSENTRPNSWVFVDIRDSDIGHYVKRAKASLKSTLQLPPGYTLVWSGQFENMERMQKRMALIVPLTLLLILLILYINTGSLVKTGMVMLAVPFSLVGAVWILYFLDYNMSVAVGVGMIALAGLDAETGVVMLLYLEQAYKKAQKAGQMVTLQHLYTAIDEGAVRRVRPKIMTASVILAGLFPILWSHGAGADVMKRIAAPMVGGVITSVLMELAVYPALFLLWKRRTLFLK
jgi:Cu(I)/Ag(I) efflux system membrane protein CusA/SilA